MNDQTAQPNTDQPTQPAQTQPNQPMFQVQPAAPKPQPKPEAAIKYPPLLWENTQKLLADIEAYLGGKVVTYYLRSSIMQDDVKYFYAHLNRIGYQKKLYFILTSSGGSGMSSFRIAALLRNFCDELAIILPERAESAATLLSLAADELIMTPLSYLGAIDTSLVHPLNPKDPKGNPIGIEIEEINKSIEIISKNNGSQEDRAEAYKAILSYVHPVALGAVQRSSNLSKMIASDILDLRKNKLTPENKEKLITRLNSEYPSHGYPIPRHKAKELGFNVMESSPDLDKLLWDLNNMYRYSTEEVRSELSETYLHYEQYTKIIESLGTRLFVSNVWERKLDPILKGWSTFKDEFKWMSALEKEENGAKKVKISYLEF